MKILFTGGDSGGHFTPIIAVAEAIQEIQDVRKLVEIKMYYMSNKPYDRRALFELGITYRFVPSGKKRPGFSIRNFVDSIKIMFGAMIASWRLFLIYPDVVFGKGGGASLTTLMAARLLRIPVFIHESDTYPGRVNQWAGKFARRIAIAAPEAAQYFPKDRTALVGIPVRRVIREPLSEGAYEFLKLEKGTPTILILGGSQGALNMNNVVVDVLPYLLNSYQVIHQTGAGKIADTKLRADFVLEQHPLKNRYRVFEYLNVTALRMSAGVANLVVTRGGNTSIFEIAGWGVPSIIVPMDEDYSVGDHQRKNAYSYARGGGAVVIEDKNLHPTILRSEIDRILTNPELAKKMGESARLSATPNASHQVAEELIKIALEHE